MKWSCYGRCQCHGSVIFELPPSKCPHISIQLPLTFPTVSDFPHTSPTLRRTTQLISNSTQLHSTCQLDSTAHPLIVPSIRNFPSISRPRAVCVWAGLLWLPRLLARQRYWNIMLSPLLAAFARFSPCVVNTETRTLQ